MGRRVYLISLVFLIFIQSYYGCKTVKPTINAIKIDGVYKKHSIAGDDILRLYPNMTYSYTIYSHGLGGYDHLGKWTIDRDTLLLDNFPQINQNHFSFEESFDNSLGGSKLWMKFVDSLGKPFEDVKVIVNDTITKFTFIQSGELLLEGIQTSKLRFVSLTTDTSIILKPTTNRLYATIYMYPVLQTMMHSRWKIETRSIIPYDKKNLLLKDQKLSK